MIRALYRLVFVNVLGNVWLLVVNALRLLRLPGRPRWVEITIDDKLRARPAARRWFGRKHPSLAGLHSLLDRLLEDPGLQGVVFRIKSLPRGWATLQSLRGLMQRVSAANKRTVAHLSGASLAEYYVACAADQIVADEAGTLHLVGVAAETVFWADALAKLGVRAQAEYKGAYKSFAETFTRGDMSPAHREAATAVIDNVFGELCGAVATARKVTRERAEEMITGGPYTARQASDAGLIDAVLYWDELPGWLGSPAPRLAKPGAWARARLKAWRWRPLFGRRSVRVISLHGAIVTGEGSEFPRQLVGSAAAERALDSARKEASVAAVVLHVDSRGGSAHASDLIWRAVVRLARQKPVVAYFDDVAASGGYYLACASHKIIAQPLTLTGSIGVVGGKLDLSGLYDKLGLQAVFLDRGVAAGMNHPSRGYSEEERRRLRAEVAALYEQFVRKVAEGRKLSLAQADTAAQGRVWSGVDAASHGLVDELGDATRAIELAKELGRRRPNEKLQVHDVAIAPRRSSLIPRGLTTQLSLPRPLADAADLAAFAGERVLMVPLYNLYWP